MSPDPTRLLLVIGSTPARVARMLDDPPTTTPTTYLDKKTSLERASHRQQLVGIDSD
jgi:hypothetical protein